MLAGLRRRELFVRGSTPPLRPPWTGEDAIAAACTGCGACNSVCPAGIIMRDAWGRPRIAPQRGECTFCGACADACPEPVFDRSLPPFDHIARVTEACFGHRGVFCQCCADQCPQAAIVFHPRRGGPPVPSVIAAACTGCLACIATCPAGAIELTPSVGDGVHA
jgi:ferredoxin-type protein NapF